VDALFERVELEYEGIPHRRFDCDFSTAPAVEARLALEGYECSEALLMLLEGELRSNPRPDIDVRPISDEGMWAIFFELHAMDWVEYRGRIMERGATDVGEAMAQRVRDGSPPMRYYMAYADGQPRAYFGAWDGIDGMGQVENLFTHPDYRHRGLATALIVRCVADCRERGAGPVLIVADPSDTPMRMYASMGFRPLALKREWRRENEMRAGA
jgi:GNAT superfamily N-acetyltransferase